MVGLGVALFMLVHRGLIQIDLSFPWFLAIILLGLLSYSEDFVAFAADILGIIYPPIAIIFAAIFVLFGLVTIVLIVTTVLRRRQIGIVRTLAGIELLLQERRADLEAHPPIIGHGLDDSPE